MRLGTLRMPLLLGGLALGAAGNVGCESDLSEPLPSVRLGMAPRDVRERFEPGGQGTWQTRMGSADDTYLEWISQDPASRVPAARFEFHLGMLVAVRARLASGPSSERIEKTARTVTWRKAAPEGGTSVTVLARDCPTHKDEADALVARAR
jgi:hypothetical protein